MTDFNEPTTTTTYTNWPTVVNGKIASVAKLDYTGDTNIPTGAWRLNAATRLVEQWSGSAWVVKGYLISASATGVGQFTGTLSLQAVSAPGWDTASYLWTEGGFGARYDGYQHRFDVGNSRTAAMMINTAGYTTFGAATSGSVPVNIYSGVLSAGGVSGAYAGFRFTLDPAEATYSSLYFDTAAGTSHYITMKRHASGSGGDFKIGTADADPFKIITSGSDRVTVLSGGNVGIGTTGPSYQLQLSSDSAAKPSTNTWTIASDSRLKKNVVPYTKGLDEVCALQPIEYDYNGKGGMPENAHGVSIIAQDAQIPFPECVGTYLGKLNPEDEEETEIYNWNGHALAFALINAVKELKAKNEALEARIAALEA